MKRNKETIIMQFLEFAESPGSSEASQDMRMEERGAGKSFRALHACENLIGPLKRERENIP